MRPTRHLLSLSLAVAVAACGSSSEDTPREPAAASGGAGGGSAGSGGAAAGAAGGAGAAGASATIEWAPCTLFSDGTGPAAECARLQVPLRASAPDGRRIEVFVKRYRAEGVEPKAQLHMLAGGPGASGIIYERQAEALVAKDPSLEIYLPDHRGTGRSTRLGCPEPEVDSSLQSFYVAASEWPACVAAISAEWGADVGAFNTTEAANDVGAIIAGSRRPGARVIVFGASYGTAWAQRYLQRFPAQADGVILDAIVPPGGSLARQDEDADVAAKRMFAACAADTGCRARLGDDPRARTLALYEKLDQGHCKKLSLYGAPRVVVRRLLGQLMMSEETAHLIPAVVARAERCLAEDTKALLDLAWYFFGRTGGAFGELTMRQWGWYLSNQIAFSEMWETPSPTVETLAAWREKAAVSRDVTSGFEGALDVVPRYAPDAYHGAFATTDTPMLMLQGDWDPATLSSKATAVRDHYKGAHQTWVDLPGGGHGALGRKRDAAGVSCGTSMILRFCADPKQPVDSSCLATAVEPSWDGSPALNNALFGTEDLWGGL